MLVDRALNAAPEVDPDLPVNPASLDAPETPVLPVPLDSPDALPLLLAFSPSSPHADPAPEDSPVRPAHRDLLDSPEPQDSPVPPAETLLPAHLAHPEPLDSPDTPDSLEDLDSPETPLPALLPLPHHLAHQESKEPQDSPDNPEDLDSPEPLDSPAPRDHLAHPEDPETMASPDNPAPPDSPETPASLVSARNTVPSTEECSSPTAPDAPALKPGTDKSRSRCITEEQEENTYHNTGKQLLRKNKENINSKHKNDNSLITNVPNNAQFPLLPLPFQLHLSPPPFRFTYHFQPHFNLIHIVFQLLSTPIIAAIFSSTTKTNVVCCVRKAPNKSN
jgi:hypothetical protein